VGHPAVSLRLEDVDPPRPGPGEVAIRVGAGTVNFADILLCQGIYQDRPPTPFTPGLETSGVVEAVGPDVDLPIGAHIGGMAALPAGGFAERALVRAPAALVMPDHIPFTDATVLYSTYQTAHVALHHRGGLAEGEWLLVLGGAGGVGSAAIQLGVAAGARVVAVAGGPDKVALCRTLGAHHVVDHHHEDLYDTVMEVTEGHGVDVAFDPVGGVAGDVTRRLLAWEGRLLVIGFASGDIPAYAANHVLVKNYAVLGVHWSTYPHRRRPVVESAHADLLRLYDSGQVRPLVTDVVGLEGIPAALEALERRQVQGRIVVDPWI
jgi:NADPH2:quinone reductase